MKKIYFLLPILLSPTLFSCGGNPTPGPQPEPEPTSPFPSFPERFTYYNEELTSLQASEQLETIKNKQPTKTNFFDFLEGKKLTNFNFESVSKTKRDSTYDNIDAHLIFCTQIKIRFFYHEETNKLLVNYDNNYIKTDLNEKNPEKTSISQTYYFDKDRIQEGRLTFIDHNKKTFTTKINNKRISSFSTSCNAIFDTFNAILFSQIKSSRSFDSEKELLSSYSNMKYMKADDDDNSLSYEGNNNEVEIFITPKETVTLKGEKSKNVYFAFAEGLLLDNHSAISRNLENENKDRQLKETNEIHHTLKRSSEDYVKPSLDGYTEIDKE